MTIYSQPEKYGLATIGEIDWSDGNYQFDLTVVWKRESDGAFVYGEGAGCSCPEPFDDFGMNDLIKLRKIGGLEDFKTHCSDRQAGIDRWSYPEDRRAETVALLERMYAEGAR